MISAASLAEPAATAARPPRPEPRSQRRRENTRFEPLVGGGDPARVRRGRPDRRCWPAGSAGAGAVRGLGGGARDRDGLGGEPRSDASCSVSTDLEASSSVLVGSSAAALLSRSKRVGGHDRAGGQRRRDGSLPGAVPCDRWCRAQPCLTNAAPRRPGPARGRTRRARRADDERPAALGPQHEALLGLARAALAPAASRRSAGSPSPANRATQRRRLGDRRRSARVERVRRASARHDRDHRPARPRHYDPRHPLPPTSFQETSRCRRP